MDSPIKTGITLFFTFLGVGLLLSILLFGIVTNKARDVLQTTVDYIQIAGFDEDVIQNLANDSHTSIQVTPTADDGIYSNGGMTRFTVEVTYSHGLFWLDVIDLPSVTLRAVTKPVEY